MAYIKTHTSSGERTRVLLLLASALGAALLAVSAIPTPQATAASGSYQWPIKPFDQPHPIRGSFGDPRTVFRAPPTLDGVLRGEGSFAHHFGVDIATRDGSRVYPVLSGVVSKVTPDWVAVDVGNGRVFQYWHIIAAVREGDAAKPGQTVLGKTKDGFGHVHFSELKDGRAANPLRAGGLTPYRDTTVPRVEDITLRGTSTGRDLVPNLVRGKVQFVAEAYDSPELAIPWPWNNMPVSPAKIAWRIQHITGRVVVRTQVAEDVRSTIPRREHFWEYYARGTFQNFSVFTKHYSYGEPGRFLFKLTKTQFDTRSLRDGVYELFVTASDIAGNASTSSLRFTIRNGEL